MSEIEEIAASLTATKFGIFDKIFDDFVETLEDVGVPCSATCTATFPQIYPVVAAALKVAKNKGLITSKSRCNQLAENTGELVEVLTAAQAGPVIAAAARALSKKCAKCACDDVF